MSGHLSKFRKSLVGLLKALFALGLLYWLYQKGVLDFKILSKLFNPTLLAVAFVTILLNMILGTWRWQLLLRVQNLSLNLWECLKLNLVGSFFNYIVPGGVGGDVVKAFYIVKAHPQNRMGSGMSVLLDRLLGLYAMLMLAIGSLVYSYKEVMMSPQLTLIAKSLGCLFVVFSLGLILALSEKFRNLGWQKWLSPYAIGTKLLSAYDAVYSYSHNLLTIGWTILISIAAQSTSILLIWGLGYCLGFEEVSLSTYFSVVPLGFMVTAVPISPAGLGVGQMAFFFLFNLFLGGESQVGPAVITAYQALTFIISLSGLWFFVRQKHEWKEVEAGAIGS